MKTRTLMLGLAVGMLACAGLMMLGAPADAAGIAFVLANTPAAVPATEEGLKQLADALKATNDELKKFAEDANKQIKASGELSAEAKKAVDELLLKQTDIAARIGDVEQKLARRSGGQPEYEARSPGEQFVAAEAVKSFMKDKPRAAIKVPVKNLGLYSAIMSTGQSGGALVIEDRRPGIVAAPQRRLTIRGLIMPGRTSSNSIEYVREAGFTNNARPVTEGEQKPESTITFELETAAVRTVAHFVQASKQILDDAPMLQSYVDGRLRYGLALVEEEQILLGDGTGQNLDGIIPLASAYDPAFTPEKQTRIDQIRLALLQVTLAEYEANGIVMHPADWAEIELTKDTQGRYIIGNPQSQIGPALWGKPVVPTLAMTDGDFLTGAFDLGAQLFDREDANVEISTEDRDNFIKNMVTVRAEERLVQATYRPEAFVTGQFLAGLSTGA